MKELSDYSGPLKPDIGFEDFSKEALIRLLYAYAAAYAQAAGYFMDIIRERHGEDEAWRSLVEFWMRMGPLGNLLVCEALNIQPKDVESWLKSLQLDPAYPPNLFGAFGTEYRSASHMELKDKNHGTFTLERCLALEAAEQGGKERVMQICHGIEHPTFTNTPRVAHNPNIKSRPLKLAPRESADETPACIWEWWIDEGQ
jgi:hypothetical protein